MLTKGEDILLPPSANWYSSNISSVSRDGRLFAYAASNTIVVVDTNRKRFINVLTGHTKRVSAICFMVNSGLLLSGGLDKALRIWDAVAGQCTRALHKRPSEISAIASLNSFSECAVVGDKTGKISLWPVEMEGKPRILATKLKSAVTTMAGSPVPAASHVAVGTEDGMITIVDVELDVVVTQLLNNAQAVVQSLSWALSRKASYHTKRQNMQLNTQTVVPKVEENGDQMALDSLVALQINPMEPGLNSEEIQGGQLVQLHLRVDAQEGGEQVTCTLEAQREIETNLESGHINDSLIAAGCQDGEIRIWKSTVEHDPPEITSVSLIKALQLGKSSQGPSSAQGRKIWITVQLCPFYFSYSGGFGSGCWVLASGPSGELSAWKVSSITGEASPQIKLPLQHHRSIFGIELMKRTAGHFAMITLGMDRSMLLWELHCPLDCIDEGDWRNFKVKWTTVGLGGDILSTDVGPSSVLAVGCGDKTVRLVSLSSDSVLKGNGLRWRGISDKVTGLQWNPKNQELLGIGCEDGTVSLMRLSSDNTFKYPLRHKHSVVCLQWKSCVKVTGEISAQLFTMGEEGCLLRWPDIAEDLFTQGGHDKGKKGLQGISDSVDPVDVTRKLSGVPPGPAPKWSCFSWDPSGNFLALGTSDGRIALYMDLMSGDQVSMQCSTRSNHSSIKQLHWKLPQNAAPTLCVLSSDGRLSVFEIGLDTCGEKEGMVLKSLCKIGGDPIESAAWLPQIDHRQIIAIGRKGRNVCLLKAWDPQTSLQPLYVKQISGGVGSFKCADEGYLVATRSGNYISKLHLESLPNPNSVVPQAGIRSSDGPSLDFQADQHGKQSLDGIKHVQNDNVESAGQEVQQNGAFQSDLDKGITAKVPDSSVPKPVRISGHKRKISSLGSKPIFQDNDEELPGDDDLSDICLQAASVISVQNESIQKGMNCPSIGLFSSHIEASVDLKKRTESIEVNDSISAEKKAAMYIWQGNVEAAMDVLSDADCLDGDYVSMAVSAGVDVWTAVTRKRAIRLEGMGDAHLAALHYLSLGEIKEAIEVYRRGNLAEDALRLASARLLPDDPLMTELLREKAESDLSASKHLIAAAGYLTSGNYYQAIEALTSNLTAHNWCLAARVVKMIKSSVPSAQTLSCPIEALEKALITFALQGNRAVVQQVLEAWVDSKLLCCAFLSNSILEREIRDFDTLCHKGGMRSEPSIADVFRVVGIAAPIWAKTLETMMVGGKAKMDCEAKDALARLQIICDNPVVKESVHAVRASRLCECFLRHIENQSETALNILVELSNSVMHTEPLPISTSDPHEFENQEGSCYVPDGSTEFETEQLGGVKYTISELKEMETDPEKDQLLFDSNILPDFLRRVDEMDTEPL